jgi:pyridinium-3,5-biscarboxylic acid mononucleotide synthase
MDPNKLKDLLQSVRVGAMTIEAAVEALAQLPFSDIGAAVVDHHRAIRAGFPEVIFGEPKTAAQIAAIARELAKGGGNVLATRVDAEKAAAVRALFPEIRYAEEARCLVLEQAPIAVVGRGPVAVVTAGTADGAVAEEVALVARLAGNEVLRVSDVGVAGVHRLLHRLDDLRRATVLVVVAGMEGALPSVVAGLVAAPVIAVPTSVGYGASFGGVTALLAMLSSCAAGVTVVNIDNGFGAGVAAALMNRDRARGGAA